MDAAQQTRAATIRALAAQYPTTDAAIAEAAALSALLTLPMGVVHVISDIHGEDAKLRHVINNGSGSLRQLVDRVLGNTLSPEQKRRFLAVLYYPREAINAFSREIVASGDRQGWVFRTLTQQFEIVKALRGTYRRVHFERLLPVWYRELFIELGSGQRPEYVKHMIARLSLHDRDWGAVRAGARLIRNLACDELIVAGDLGDRGPRMDRVIETLKRQPSVRLLWGNHDMLWMGALLGHEPCMHTVLRFSLRYRRLSQLEEGYGVIMAPIERLVRQVYADDPAERFMPKGEGFRDAQVVARMQKAVAIMQFKAEGQMLARRPEWNLEHRRLLHRINAEKGVITLGGVEHPLLDRHLPTIDPADPYAYSPEEKACVERLKESFSRSMRLREHVDWMVRHGGMWQRQDDVLVFHACVPVDDQGTPLSMNVDGRDVRGRDLFDAMNTVVRRAVRKRWYGLDEDADWLWYLWGGPLSPLFGKDKLATFETYFLADKATHKEVKNPYFDLMHDAGFMKRVGAMFGCGEDVMVVNGHVPVKIEKGEAPVKRGGNAVTIDGAFSEAYGDRGYTLVLRPDRIDLCEHSPFRGVAAVVGADADIVPSVSTIRSYGRVRTIGDTARGEEIRRQIEDLEELVRAYEDGREREQDAPPRW
jgi:fructose-1,6-bisphosphatase III